MTKETAEALIEENLETIYAWALSRVFEKHDAEDLAQDVIVAAIENISQLRCDKAFYGWFWQIASNTLRAYIRSKKRANDELPDDAVSDDDTEKSVLKSIDCAHLRRELSFLAEKHRICTVEYYWGGLSVKEIAKKHSMSAENVKYCLFKTRQILKEGIAMERQFGEKSFNPEPFRFDTLISGYAPNELRMLLNQRKLLGQIALSAYYTPMSVQQLSFELGIPTVYIKDDIDMLHHYGILKYLTGGKYQTNIFIKDDPFDEKLYERIRSSCADKMSEICTGIKNKLDRVRQTSFASENLSDAEVLRNLIAFVTVEGVFTSQSFSFDNAQITLEYYGKHGKEETKVLVTGNATTEDGKKKNLIAEGTLISNFGAICDFGVLAGSDRFFASVVSTNKEIDFSDLKELKEKINKSEVSLFKTKEEYKDFIELMCPEIPLFAEVIKESNSIALDIAENMMPKGLEINKDALSSILVLDYASILLDHAVGCEGFESPDSPTAGVYFYDFDFFG